MSEEATWLIEINTTHYRETGRSDIIDEFELHRGGGRSRTSGSTGSMASHVTRGSPGLQEFDIKLIDTVDLEGGPGTQFAL